MMHTGESRDGSADHYTAEEYTAGECYCFESLKWAHGLTFLLQIIQLILKQKHYFNSSQVLQGLLIPMLYMNAIFYTIYTVKLNKNAWSEEYKKQEDAGTGTIKINHVHAWLILEIMVFFNWITTSMFFVGFAYLRKFKSISKDEKVMNMDDNVWNDKDTDDFLRYLKFEYFLYNYILCKLITEIFIQFDLGAFDHHIFGVKDSKVTGVIITIQIFNSFIQLMSTSKQMRSGEKLKVDEDGLMAKITNHQKGCDNDSFVQGEEQASSSGKLMTGLGIFVWCINFGTMAYLFINSDYMNDQNVIAKYWTQVELLGFLLEYPIHFIQYKFMLNKQQQIIDAGKERQRLEADEVKEEVNNSVNEGGEHHAHGHGGDDGGVTSASSVKEKFEALEKKVTDKSQLCFEEDFLSMTIFSYLKSNRAVWDSKNNKLGWGINAEKQAQMLYSVILVVIVVCSMLFCMLYQMSNEEAPLHFPHDFSVFYVKFPCAVALHFCLYPEVARGMEMMKFANNQQHQFVENGAEISYCIAFLQVFTALLAEYINISLLCGQHTVDHCIIHFVALEVIMEVSSLYFESLMHNKLCQVLHHPPMIEAEGKGQKFTDRSCFHKIARVFYKILRCFYVSMIYYFVPFSVLYVQWTLEVNGEGHAHE